MKKKKKEKKEQVDLIQVDRWGGRRAVAGAAVEAQADLSSLSLLSDVKQRDARMFLMR